MLIELPIVWIVVLNIAGWLVIQLGLAWLFLQMPENWFQPRGVWAWERRGHFYETFFLVRYWKGWLPDAARWFSGGFAKSVLLEKNPDYLRRFVCETLRGETCHWLAIACTPLFLLWNPWWGLWVNLAYALVANAPCILVQRYNRARFLGLLAKRFPSSSDLREHTV